MIENTSRHGSAQVLDERMTAATDKFENVTTERAADVITGREESWKGRGLSLMIPAVALSQVKRGSYRQLSSPSGRRECYCSGDAIDGPRPGAVQDDSLVAATSVLSQHITTAHTSSGQQTAAQKLEYTSDDDAGR